MKIAMGIFLVAIAIEIAFAVFCIRTRSNHRRERSFVRIASFMIFVLLAFLPVIDWSLRYYGLVSLLFFKAIIGAIALIQQKKEKKPFKTGRIVLKAIGMIVLILVFTMPAILFPQNRAVMAATGEHQVLTQTYTYTDKNRDEGYKDGEEKRMLNVQWWYPDNSGEKYPLIVFSHGGLGVKSSNESLYNELASHGYVVCSIDHTYQSFYTVDEEGDLAWIDFDYMKELFEEDSQTNIHQSYEYYQTWMKIRTDDLGFVIDHTLVEVENPDSDMLYRLVDMEKIGVMGHSLGGSAALGIGRIRNDVDAIVALESPFMYDIEGVKDEQFVFTDKSYPVPVLNVYSDSSWEILGERPQYAVNHDLLGDTEATAFNVHISGIGHLALTDFSLSSPILTQILDGQDASMEETLYALETINKICLEFFNSYLKESGEFTSSGSY